MLLKLIGEYDYVTLYEGYTFGGGDLLQKVGRVLPNGAVKP